MTVLDTFKGRRGEGLRTWRERDQGRAAANPKRGLPGVEWREGSYRSTVASRLTLQPYRKIGKTQPLVTDTEVAAASYKIDNLKARIAVDVEWQANDGNLDRDIAAYRSLYDAGIIDATAIITVSQTDMRDWARALHPSSTKFGTTTTTNVEKS